MSLPFLTKFKKELAKLENVSTDFRPPSHWYTTGNLAVNKIMSGDYHRGIPQGRITILAGPSGAGKSFLLGNIIKAAQADGAFVVAIDSENAIDTDWLQRIGVDVSEKNFLGISVVTIADTIVTVSDFIKMYEKEYGKYNVDAPKVVIALDSLDMLLTESEEANFNAGVQKGDQGQRAKQIKAFLRTVVSRIKALNIAFIGTHQVYPADVLAGEGKWAVNNAMRYSASQIVLLTKLKLKEEKEVIGIRMSCETFKSRFSKLGSKVEVLVPYDTGMNPYSGLIDLLEADKVIVKSGAWLNCTFPGEKTFSFQSTKMDKELVERLLSHPFITDQSKQFEDKLRVPETPEELGEVDPDLTEKKAEVQAVLTETINGLESLQLKG
jgi:RecA/RadA recombinase